MEDLLPPSREKEHLLPPFRLRRRIMDSVPSSLGWVSPLKSELASSCPKLQAEVMEEHLPCCFSVRVLNCTHHPCQKVAILCNK